MIETPLILFGALVLGHALADGPLQPPDLARLKRSDTPSTRLAALVTHGAAHGVLVGLLTGDPVLGLAETLLHALIDAQRSRQRIPSWLDQTLHIACKVAYVVAVC